MRRFLTLSAALLASGIAVLTATPSLSRDTDGKRDHRTRDTVWVTNRDLGTLMVFDALTGDAVTPVPITIGTGIGMGTHDLVVSRRAGRAFLMNETVNSVTVLSASTGELEDTLPLGPRPHHTKLSADEKTVYVGLFGTNRIAAINAKSLNVREFASSEEPAEGAPRPLAHAPRPSPDGRSVFVPHEMGNLVTMLSARSGRIRRSVSPGDTPAGQPTEVLSTRDGETLYVAMRNEGKIKTIDVESFEVTGERLVGAQPESLILVNDERTLVISMRGSPAQLAVVDTETLTLKGTIPIGGPGTFGDLAVGSPNGRYVYATFDTGMTGFGGVAKVDLHRGTVTTWPYPTVGRVHGIAYSRVPFKEARSHLTTARTSGSE